MHALHLRNPILAGVALAAVAAALGPFTPQRAAAQTPEIYSYEETGAAWGDLPDGRTWGAPTGVKMDPDRRHLWVLERCGDYNGPGCAISDLPAILKFDSSGNLVQSFGSEMFVFPHGLWVDHDSNVWVADGRGYPGRGHQIFKFSPDGELLLTIGQPGVPGEERYLLNRPSDVAIAANGDIFVADGHSPMDTNMRIVKYSADGTYIKEWGEKGAAPGQLDGAHGLALDSEGRLFVADRGNNRVQIFDQEGNFVDAWTQFGSPSGLYVSPDDVLYVADLAEGIRFGSAKDGVVTGHIRPATPPDGGTVRVAESVTVDENGILYAGENAGMVLMRFEIPR
ncbi:MAG: peptidyl-alpha-hydroxyglycine alpha-amidating lyase family protein [Gammaproteobacteria bacterium]|nr:peptidyl-alpha-hydroxyglycine alpha-amidating lyase family protein [Gammaproteobacteria bacterium]